MYPLAPGGRGDADLIVFDGSEVRTLLLVVARRVVVDVVAHPPPLVPYLDEFVLVEPASEPGDPRTPEPLAGQIGRVDVEDSSRRKTLEGYPSPGVP